MEDKKHQGAPLRETKGAIRAQVLENGSKIPVFTGFFGVYATVS